MATFAKVSARPFLWCFFLDSVVDASNYVRGCLLGPSYFDSQEVLENLRLENESVHEGVCQAPPSVCESFGNVTKLVRICIFAIFRTFRWTDSSGSVERCKSNSKVYPRGALNWCDLEDDSGCEYGEDVIQFVEPASPVWHSYVVWN